MGQKHSIFVCRDSGEYNSFITKIACSEVPSGFDPCYTTGSVILEAVLQVQRKLAR